MEKDKIKIVIISGASFFAGLIIMSFILGFFVINNLITKNNEIKNQMEDKTSLLYTNAEKYILLEEYENAQGSLEELLEKEPESEEKETVENLLVKVEALIEERNQKHIELDTLWTEQSEIIKAH